MHTLYPKLDEASLDALRQLYTTLPHTVAESHRRRMGEHKQENLSVYNYTRWYHWTNAEREQFKALLPPRQVKDSLIGWYLELPAGEGLLDRMTYWVDKKQYGTSIAYALDGDQSIWINDVEVVVPYGQGIGFTLKQVHEIPKVTNSQLWACLMVIGDPVRFSV